ncbi:MAG: hypothetical protein OES84_02715, partial [Kiritimatiellaceae bacterium]|nr:hypothetical protein [Kiritimatiellaceae bacterium]
MNVVWLIQNLVPYHHARFEAFSKNEGVNAHLIQVTDKDDFSVLEFQPERQDYQLHTLFPGRDRSAISTLDIAEQLEKKLSGINPDCACVSGWGMVIGQRLQAWALARRIPVVMFSESTTHDEPRVFYKEWLKGVLVRNASAALVGGASHRDYIHQLGMPSESVFDGHNVVDGHYFSDPAGARPEELPAWLENEPYFAVCTRFGEKKNLPRLVRAYARYTEKCGSGNLDPARLVLGGDGETRREVEAEIKALNMQD